MRWFGESNHGNHGAARRASGQPEGGSEAATHGKVRWAYVLSELVVFGWCFGHTLWGCRWYGGIPARRSLALQGFGMACVSGYGGGGCAKPRSVSGVLFYVYI